MVAGRLIYREIDHSQWFYTPCSNSQVSSHLTFLTESLPTDEQQTETSRGNRNKCSVPGILHNTNTLEGYHALDKQGLLKAEVKKAKSVSA
ncbi:hypothetical protein L2E82_49116 [Cichorium intybus]|uniref:Uncharacterized protein n=1 Tax=Cichorium intybus TaxID=13427 RepID=A0ACB8YZT2_CICIN|nr:hypothetical protein L2E82_49116 [Cichorium intybus]